MSVRKMMNVYIFVGVNVEIGCESNCMVDVHITKQTCFSLYMHETAYKYNCTAKHDIFSLNTFSLAAGTFFFEKLAAGTFFFSKN